MEETKVKIIIGVTEDNELYSVEIGESRFKDGSGQKPYFSVTGGTVRAIDEETAEQEARERLEDGELWKHAVEYDNTTMGLDEWVEYVIDMDGYESMFDIDYKMGNVEVEGKTYVFDWQSGGQHVVEPELIKHYFVPAGVHKAINALWDVYHLRAIDSIEDIASYEAIKRMGEGQDVEKIKKEFIGVINK